MRGRGPMRRTTAGSNHAASTRMFFVSGVIMVSHPPITPARPSAFFSSATTTSSASSARTADNDGPCDLVEIEGVGGVPHADQHVVARIDRIEDQLLAKRGESFR